MVEVHEEGTIGPLNRVAPLSGDRGTFEATIANKERNLVQLFDQVESDAACVAGVAVFFVCCFTLHDRRCCGV